MSKSKPIGVKTVTETKLMDFKWDRMFEDV